MGYSSLLTSNLMTFLLFRASGGVRSGSVSVVGSVRRCLCVPDWSSIAVTCGIAGPWSSKMIVCCGGTTARSDLPEVLAWLGLLARSAHLKDAEILVSCWTQQCCSTPTPLRTWLGYRLKNRLTTAFAELAPAMVS